MVSQSVIPSKQIFGGAKPFAFTELGIAMLSSVLNSQIAIQVNITILGTFVNSFTIIPQQNKLLQTDTNLCKSDVFFYISYVFVKTLYSLNESSVLFHMH